MSRKDILKQRIARLRKQIKAAEIKVREGFGGSKERARKKDLLIAVGESIAAAQDQVSSVLEFAPDDKLEEAMLFLYEASKIIRDHIPRGPA